MQKSSYINYMIKLYMSIEELLYSAENHGKRTDLLLEVSKIKNSSSGMSLQEIYDQAYQIVMKT